MSSPGPHKSQLFHNFEMPPLKWSTKPTNSTRLINQELGRRTSDSSSSSVSLLQASPLGYTRPLPIPSAAVSDAAQELSFHGDSAFKKSPTGAVGSKSRSAFSSWSTNDVLMEEDENSSPYMPKSDYVSVASPTTASSRLPSNKVVQEPKTQTYCRHIRIKNKDQLEGSNEAKIPDESKPDDLAVKVEKVIEEPEFTFKTWNLRPRKPVVKKPFNGNSGSFNHGGGSSQDNKAQPPKAKGGSNKEKDETEKKRQMPKFSVALSCQEIEDDMYALTGKKPTRKPKKRSKAVQRQLDICFPGLYLGTLTIESYKPAPASKD